MLKKKSSPKRTPREPKPKHLVLTCDDRRLRVQTQRFLNKKFGIGKWDRVVFLGALTHCVNPSLVPSLTESIWWQFTKRLSLMPTIANIWVLHHEDCKGAESYLGAGDENNLEFHTMATNVAADWIIHRSRNSGMNLHDMPV